MVCTRDDVRRFPVTALAASVVAVMFALSGCDAQAQAAPKFQSAPATDTSAQASPIGAPVNAKATDSAIDASPVIGPSTTMRSVSLRPGTAVPVKLVRSIDSGKLKNGETVRATLAAAVKTTSGATLAAGSPVSISVIATVPAGKLNAVGEFSLQAMTVGEVSVFTDTQTFRGAPGHKDLPDSAPTTGTDAGLARGAELTFHVQKPPVAADGPPPQGGVAPGSVDGRASGGAPPAGSTSGNTMSGNTPAAVTPANNSFQKSAPTGTTTH